MEDKNNVVTSLQATLRTCESAQTALQDVSGVAKVSEESDVAKASLQTLLSDFMSLLSFLYQSTTKLALALKPSDPTYKAALTPLQDLRTNVDAIASCASIIDGEQHGGTLAREVRWAAGDVVSALQALLCVFVNAVTGSPAEAKSYLLKTGAIHEAIDHARNMSRSNRQAVRKRWESDMAGLEDCITEISELVEGDGDEAGEDLDDFEEGDMWDDLDPSLPSRNNSERPSKEELERLKLAHELLKITHEVQKNILTAVLMESSSLEVVPTSKLDGLLKTSNSLLASSDELVSTLDIPHDLGAIRAALESFSKLLCELRSFLVAYDLTSTTTPVGEESDIIRKTASLSLRPSDRSSEMTKFRVSFDLAFARLSQLGKKISGSEP